MDISLYKKKLRLILLDSVFSDVSQFAVGVVTALIFKPWWIGMSIYVVTMSVTKFALYFFMMRKAKKANT